eukprot:7420898-Prorocentrum_lima.AAC.1
MHPDNSAKDLLHRRHPCSERNYLNYIAAIQAQHARFCKHEACTNAADTLTGQLIGKDVRKNA